MTTEEERAAAYRAQERSRFRNKLAREKALRPDAERTQATRDAWQPWEPVDKHGVPRLGCEDYVQ